MTEDNVVMFPKAKKDSPLHTREEVEAKVLAARKDHVEYVIDETLSFVFSRCYEEGFNLNNDDCFKSTGMLVEAMRAALYKSVGISHPLHMVAEEIFSSDEEAIEQTENIMAKSLDGDDSED
jgi:hypothetical protein